MLVVVSLALATMLGILNGMAIGPFLSTIAEDLDTSVPLLGQIAAVALGSFGTALAPNFGLMLAIRLGSSFSGAILGGVSLAIAASLFSGDAQRRALSWTTAGIAVGPIAGIPLLAWLGAAAGWRAAFVALSGVALLIGALLIWTLPTDRRLDSGRLRMVDIVNAYRPLIADRLMLSLYGASILRSVTWVGTLIYLGAYFADVHGLSVDRIGLALMVFGFGYLIGSVAAGGWLGHYSLNTLFMVSTLLMSLLVAALLAIPMPVILATLLLGGAAVASGVGWVALTTLLVRETPAGRGTTMVLNGTMFSLGTAGGGIAVGLLIAVGGYVAMGVVLPLFAVCAVVVLWRIGELSERRKSPHVSSAAAREAPLP